VKSRGPGTPGSGCARTGVAVGSVRASTRPPTATNDVPLIADSLFVPPGFVEQAEVAMIPAIAAAVLKCHLVARSRPIEFLGGQREDQRVGASVLGVAADHELLVADAEHWNVALQNPRRARDGDVDTARLRRLDALDAVHRRVLLGERHRAADQDGAC